MTTYMISPMQLITVTHGGTDYILDNANGKITRLENGFDSATLTLPNTRSFGNEVFSDKATADDAITIKVKSYEDAAWTTILSGIIRTCEPMKGQGDFLKLKCEGAGYGFGQTVVAQEYGSTSSNPLYYQVQANAPALGIFDSALGIIPKWVNKIMGSTVASGFSYSSSVDVINNNIGYYVSPYKPAYKAINDICDIVTALKTGTAGPHWIVLADGTFLLTTIGNHSAAAIAAGWPTYYGGTATTATLVEGVDFASSNFQKLTKEANYVAYYGAWRRPSNGDGWTEGSASLWDVEDVGDTDTVTDDAVKYIVGLQSVRFTIKQQINNNGLIYPSGMTAAWDFSNFSDFNTPNLNFYALRSGLGSAWVVLHTTAPNNFDHEMLAEMPATDTWYHFSLPIGPYYKTVEGGSKWNPNGAPNWNSINWIRFFMSGINDSYLCIDGLHFGDAAVCRVARDKLPGGEGGTLGSATNKLRVKVITDNIGKDDSLKDTDDTGLMAQMAYAELLRARTTPLVGTITVPMMKDLLPGQLLHIHAHERKDSTFAVDSDMRVTSFDHAISGKPDGYKTVINLTTDVINSMARTRYDDWNTVLGLVRPDMQDRQATSIKAGQMDIRIARLEKGYA